MVTNDHCLGSRGEGSASSVNALSVSKRRSDYCQTARRNRVGPCEPARRRAPGARRGHSRKDRRVVLRTFRSVPTRGRGRHHRRASARGRARNSEPYYEQHRCARGREAGPAGRRMAKHRTQSGISRERRALSNEENESIPHDRFELMMITSATSSAWSWLGGQFSPSSRVVGGQNASSAQSTLFVRRDRDGVRGIDSPLEPHEVEFAQECRCSSSGRPTPWPCGI